MKKMTLLLLFAMLLLTACTQRETVGVYAKSMDWNVTIRYDPEGNQYVETAAVEYIGQGKNVHDAQVDILYSNGSFTGNRLQQENLEHAGVVELITRTKVKRWKDTQTVRITWSDGKQTFEETIKVKEQPQPSN